MSRGLSSNIKTELAKGSFIMAHLVSLEQNKSIIDNSGTFLFTDAPADVTDTTTSVEVYGYKVILTAGSTTGQIYASSEGIDEAFASIKNGNTIRDPVNEPWFDALQDDTTVTLGTKPYFHLSKTATATGKTFAEFYGDLIWQANGFLQEIGSVNETSTLTTGSLSLQLSGVNQTLISDLLNNGHLNRKVNVKRAFINSSTNAIIDSSLMFSGRVDGMELVDNEKTSTINLSLSNHWSDFARKSGRRTTSESQKQYFPNDLGFDYITISNIN